ncbi:MAG TPA: sialate O-acetylesterase, partial [Fimbriimonas sp.]|nr:sialate O-acetylesterase [Fimbriimonas sp.]
VTRLSSEAPLREIRGSWVVGSPQSIENWTGIGTAFAIELRKKLNIPVGIIQSTWGGTRIEAWMSQRALQSNELLKPQFDQYLSNLQGFDQRLERWQNEANVWDAANEKRDPGNAGFDKGWHKRDYDDSDWNEVSLPVPWEQEELREVDGASWYRFRFDMPYEWLEKPLRLELGFVGTDDLVYINGLKLGGTQGKYKQRSYFIGNGLLREDKNVIAIRVWNRSGEGGILGPNLRLGTTSGGSYMDLSTTWKTKNELVIEPPTDLSKRRPERPMGPGDRNAPAGPFSGMIAPLIPFGIKGILWYQGEGNIGQSELYESAFPSLIKDWRQRWNRPDLPFYFVQLPGYKRANEPDKALWAEMRQAQLRGLDQPYTAMVVSIDQTDPDTIHPIRKYEIGRRLANLALAQTYQRNVYAFAPYASSVRVYGNKARVNFQNLYGSLKSPTSELKGFEVLGDEGWVPATAELSGTGVWVNSPGFSPKAVRYAWSDSPEAELFNAAGNPISPFWLTP